MRFGSPGLLRLAPFDVVQDVNDGLRPIGLRPRGITPCQAEGGGEQTVPLIGGLEWTGEVPAQKWMNFYTKVLSRFATSGNMKIIVTVTVDPPNGMSVVTADETTVALHELKLAESVTIKKKES